MSAQSKNYLGRLKEQREKLNARIQSAENRVKTSMRKCETRKKILIGGYNLEKATKGNGMGELNKIMQGFLKRDSDRILFGLEQLVKKS